MEVLNVRDEKSYENFPKLWKFGLLHFSDDKPTNQPASAYNFDFKKYFLSKDDFKDLMYDEIMFYDSDGEVFK